MQCSVVVPCYNTEPNLAELHRRLTAALGGLTPDYELLFVDDGSADGTLAGLKRLAAEDRHVRYVALSRNFGQEAALLAGIDRADGDCVILMDDDLQDPPELIPALIAKWREGYEEVHALRRRRLGVGRSNRAFAFLFYRLVNRLSDTRIPVDTGNFRLLDRKAVLALRQCRERGRFTRGLIPWVGFRQGRVEYDRAARFAGRSQYTLRRLLRLVLDAACGFSVKPLRLASLLGILVTIVTFVLAAIIAVQKVFFNLTPPGYALHAAGLFFLGGMQMLFLGIIGEYLGRVYRQVQRRPLYFVNEDTTQAGEGGSGFGVRGSGEQEGSRGWTRMDADLEGESETSDSESEIPQSAIPEPRTPNPEGPSALLDRQSAIRNPQSAIPQCSVVVPCHNEEGTLRELHRRLTAVLTGLFTEYEIILVDDGSRDGTLALMKALAAADGRVRYVTFSRNFGHEVASTAGLDRAEGECVILMDADLQDPPELIPDLAAKWRAGYQEVHTTRRRRAGLGLVRRAFTRMFYRVIWSLSEVKVPPETGNFRFMDRKVVREFRRLRETGRFVCGLIPWLGYRQTSIAFDRPDRFAGESKYHFRQLFRLALDAISGFSIIPLRLAGLLGFGVTTASFALAVAVVVQKLFYHLPSAGYALSTAGLLFLGGVQMVLLGVIGEYLGRVYREVQDRPAYVVSEEGDPARAVTRHPTA